jgi:hypothetical protein
MPDGGIHQQVNLMAKLVLVGFMGLFFAWKTEAQEVKQAPTVEQCRADQRLWSDMLEDSGSLPNYVTLSGWFHEIFECKSVDPDNRQRYYNVLGEIDSAKVMRLEKFLDRHGLYDKFIEEDKSSKR